MQMPLRTVPIPFDTSIIAMMRFGKLLCVGLMTRHSMSQNTRSLPGTGNRIDAEIGKHCKTGSFGTQLAMTWYDVRSWSPDTQSRIQPNYRFMEVSFVVNSTGGAVKGRTTLFPLDKAGEIDNSLTLKVAFGRLHPNIPKEVRFKMIKF